MAVPTGSNKDHEYRKFREGDAPGEIKLGVVVEQPVSSPIPVSISPGLPTGYDVVNYYAQVLAVASGIETVVISKVVAVQEFTIEEVEVGGTNFSQFTVEINGTVVALKRTNIASPLHLSFNFNSYKLLTGDTIEVKCLHDRPSPGDFEGRLIGVELL